MSVAGRLFLPEMLEVVPALWGSFPEGAETGDRRKKRIAAAVIQMEKLRNFDFTEDGLLTLYSALLQERERAGRWMLRVARTNVESSLLEGAIRTRMSVSALGTCWRFLAGVSDALPDRVAALLRAGWLANPALPPELTGRAYMSLTDWHFMFAQTLLRDAATRGREQYPEFADLPDALVLELLSTQPIPDEWFVDVFPLPADVTSAVPAGLRKDEM